MKSLKFPKQIFCKLVILALTTSLSFVSARAYSEQDQSSNGSGSSYDNNISTTDLLESATLTSAIYTTTYGGHTAGNAVSGDNGFSLIGINDGTASDQVNATSGTTLFANGQLGSGLGAAPQLTYTLATTSPLGYTITSINSINGYGGNYSAELADQNYTVAYELVGTSTFITLASVNYAPFTSTSDNGNPATNNGSSQVTLSNFGVGGLGIAGVGALQFTFADPVGEDASTGNGELIREIDVNGAPTAASPEPSTYALIMVSLGAMIFFVRRRQLA